MLQNHGRLSTGSPHARASDFPSKTPRLGGSEYLLGAGNLYPAYIRGRIYLAAHQGAEAAGEFQKIIDHRGIVLSDPIGALARLQLGRAYALSGDRTKSRSASGISLHSGKTQTPTSPF